MLAKIPTNFFSSQKTEKLELNLLFSFTSITMAPVRNYYSNNSKKFLKLQCSDG